MLRVKRVLIYYTDTTSVSSASIACVLLVNPPGIGSFASRISPTVNTSQSQDLPDERSSNLGWGRRKMNRKPQEHRRQRRDICLSTKFHRFLIVYQLYETDRNQEPLLNDSP